MFVFVFVFVSVSVSVSVSVFLPVRLVATGASGAVEQGLKLRTRGKPLPPERKDIFSLIFKGLHNILAE